MDFPVTSRYHDIETSILEREGHEPIVYLRRRYLPSNVPRFFTGTHVVSAGERLDHLAAKYLGNPELFWRLCDANAAMRPQDLTDEIGEHVKIPLLQEG